MGTPLYISEIYKLLNDIKEVVDTRDVKIVNRFELNRDMNKRKM